MKMDKRDCLTISILTLLFAVMAFYRLGSFAAPERGYAISGENPTIVLDFGEDISLNHVSIFLGPRGFLFDAYGRAEGNEEWELIKSEALAMDSFNWEQIALYGRLRYLRLESKTRATVAEMVFFDYLDRAVVPINAAAYPGLFDEQGLYDRYLSNTYYGEAIFDEVFYAGTAYEFIHGLPTYETTHPPLGKSLVSLGIRAFGMNPFGWRFMAAIFGIMTVPLMYAFAKALVGNRFAAAAAAVLLAFDCMHFTLARLANLDVFVGFWILLMYCLFYMYLQSGNGRLTTAPTTDIQASTNDNGDDAPVGAVGNRPFKFPLSYIPLALCGLAVGLALATKWTGAFAGAGLGLLFLYHLVKHRPPQIKRLLAFGAAFFIAIPLFIYILSFRPVVLDPPLGLLQTAVANTVRILTFHTTNTDTNVYSSAFYEWPLVWKPFSCASDPLDFTFISSVNLMGNPAIWWFGLPCLVFCLYRALQKKDAQAGFLVTAYLAQYLPWVFVTRTTFIYHYYPATLFMIPAIAYTLDAVAKAKQWGRTAALGYMAVVVALFVIFYPVTSGQPATYLYQRGLEWLPEWYLVL
ncbi:MAG: phospholipid carrier-dependent glycosyltransferase [Lachnospiraceae bacterium]|jgi:dolichyl-phosphate-mannose--protein O-mannosyl transferase|nr:phospholipid carrier-dependent glycosyltransferase [Lachnospiraceae bacterium]